MSRLTTNYAKLEMMAPKRKKRKRKNKSAKSQIAEIVEKPEKPKWRIFPSERDILRKLDSWD